MTVALASVRTDADILPVYHGTPIGELLGYQNMGAAARKYARPKLLIATCLEQQVALRIPAGFAISLHTAAASLKRDPFKVSWAIGVAGVSAIAIIGHDDCGLTDLHSHREQFVARMIEAAGWERPAAEQHFDHWSDLFEISSPIDFVAAEGARLQSRYPKILVAPLLFQSATGTLQQVVAE
ncbi:MAG: carbonic anhydrase [Chromatiales bacterium]|jgi:carbonic anhydrase|nr:MAG: carbonic anhydrase [Chromatiales bacterium]